MTTITGTNSTSSTAQTGTNVLGTKQASYGENQFLLLLTEQLKNQTPFEPVDSASFNDQLASYSNMETQGQLNENLLKLLDYQGVIARSQGLSQGSALLGKEVDYVDADGDTVSGKVKSVFVDENGEVQLRLEEGDTVGLRQVVGITAPDENGEDGEASETATNQEQTSA